MNAYNDIDNALNTLGLPYYHGMPEFTEGDNPQAYIVYTMHDKPHFYTSGEPMAMEVWASVSVITAAPVANVELYNSVKTALSAIGYTYQGGNDAGTLTPYPLSVHYVMDFIKKYESED